MLRKETPLTTVCPRDFHHDLRILQVGLPGRTLTRE